MLQNFLGSEEGVSEIIGEMLLLAITVVIIGAVSLVIYSQISMTASTPIVTMDASTTNGSSITLQHGGGDTVSFSQLAFVVGSTRPTTLSPSVLVGDNNHNSVWDPGETIAIAIPPGVDNLAVYDNKSNSVMDEFTIGM